MSGPSRSDGASAAQRNREAAARALAEAAARKATGAAPAESRPRELSGRDGPEPVRYGDWEVNGIASDF